MARKMSEHGDSAAFMIDKAAGCAEALQNYHEMMGIPDSSVLEVIGTPL